MSIRQGDESGLKILYQHYADSLFGIVMRVLNSQDDAEEVLQSVFLKIWTNIESYNETKATLFYMDGPNSQKHSDRQKKVKII